MTSLTLLGLGCGSFDALTADVRDRLHATPHLFVATLRAPFVRRLPATVSLRSFDERYDRNINWSTLPQQIAALLVERAAAGEPVTFAVPGHPLVGNAIAAELRARARVQGMPTQIIAGPSLVEQACEALDADIPADGLQILDTLAVLRDTDVPAVAEPAQRAWSEIQGVGAYRPPLIPFPVQPPQPALLLHPDHRMIDALRRRLLLRYPPTHSVVALSVDDAGDRWQQHTVMLEALTSTMLHRSTVALYLPPLAVYDDVHDLQALHWVTARLLGPAGCPWDREQTHASLRRYLLEEAHETLEALDAEDWDALSEELGDLLLQIVLHSEMGRQAGRFSFGDVTAHIAQKLIRRHPHVFGDLAVSGSGDVLRNWEAIKAEEHAAKGKRRASMLDGVPVSLPALAGAQLLGEKAAKVGFDWPDIDGVWAKIYEELEEIRAAAPEQRSEEFGDLLFVLARLASWLDIDGEAALREANAKFRRRFAACERLAEGRSLASLTPEELDDLWNRAKREEHDRMPLDR